jgi:hypothetical protein
MLEPMEGEVKSGGNTQWTATQSSFGYNFAIYVAIDYDLYVLIMFVLATQQTRVMMNS